VEETKITLGHYLIAYLGLVVLWLLLTSTLAPAELILGALVAGMALLAAGPRLQLLAGLRLEPGAPLALLRYFAYFTIALIRANFDVARRVLSPKLPLHPEIVEVETRLQSELGRLWLANSITLTPGTLTVDVLADQRLRVHWIDSLPGADLKAATQRIVSGFERHMRGFLR